MIRRMLALTFLILAIAAPVFAQDGGGGDAAPTAPDTQKR